MSDLINKNQVLKDIETWGGDVEALHEYIQNMPTAYNVDKVVNELKQAIQNGAIKIESGNSKLFEIVKQGNR